MFLLDTNTVIYYFKDMGNVATRLLATPPRDVAISTVTLFELEVGIAKSRASAKRRAQLDTLVDLVTLLPFGATEAHAAASIRAKLEKRGRPIGPLDNLIAGTASAHGATIVTRNVEEFSRVKSLRIANWYDA
jgi:tRNA(fMet)-specific endonuclease VapC